MKRQLLILILLLGLGLPLLTQTDSTTLVLWHRDGTTTEVAPCTQPRVMFANGKVLVSSDVLLPTEIGMQLTDEGGKEYYARPTVGMADYAIPADQAITLKDEQAVCPDNNHPHWIDMGLPSGTQWRCCNEGASTPEAYGGYYAFGQVASAPTIDQIKEFLAYTTSEWTTLNGVNGRRFTGPNGDSVFLPAAGLRWDGEFYRVGSSGYYWSSSLYDEDGVYVLDFNSDNAYRDVEWLSYGNEKSVRPVRKNRRHPSPTRKQNASPK